MKLPWDRNYLKISFHIIFTLILVYALKLCVDLIAYILTNLGTIFTDLKGFIGWILSIFSVIVIGFIISYLCEPLVEFFQNKFDIISHRYIIPNMMKINFTKKIILKRQEKNKDVEFKSRTAGTLLTYLTIILIVIIVGGILFSKVSKSGGDNIMESMILFVNDSVNDFVKTYVKLEDTLKKYGVFEYFYDYISTFINGFTIFVRNIGNSIVTFITSIGSGIINIFISIVVAFYFLRDKDRIKHKFIEVGDAFLPKRFNTILRNTLGDIHAVFSGYIRGQLTDATIMAVLISCGLSILGVDFAILIGILSGFSNVIPYFGALIGFLLAVSVALLSGEPSKAIYAAILMLGLQQLDTIIIVPKVVGESVELSPVLVLIALAVAGQVFGIWGMILAVPIFATIKMFMGRVLDRQKLRKEQNQHDTETQ